MAIRYGVDNVSARGNRNIQRDSVDEGPTPYERYLASERGGPTPQERGIGLFGGQPGSHASVAGIGDKIFPNGVPTPSDATLFGLAGGIEDMRKRAQIDKLLPTQALTQPYTGVDLVGLAQKGSLGSEMVKQVKGADLSAKAAAERDRIFKLLQESSDMADNDKEFSLAQMKSKVDKYSKKIKEIESANARKKKGVS